MPDPAVVALATASHAKVMVFVDGQNLYQACRRIFGHPLCYPHLLAEYLAGVRTSNQVATRFYTGRPSSNIPGETVKVRNLDRRLQAMRAAGITVVTRRLRYHWDWGHLENLPPAGPNSGPQNVTLRPWQRPHEKGIDAAIALDVVEFAFLNMFDVAIIVSLDRDLHEIPRTMGNLKSVLDRPIRLEAAVPVPDNLRTPKKLPGFAYTHQIDSSVFNRVKDSTNYTVEDQFWAPTAWPKSLADLPPPPPSH